MYAVCTAMIMDSSGNSKVEGHKVWSINTLANVLPPESPKNKGELEANSS